MQASSIQEKKKIIIISVDTYFLSVGRVGDANKRES